MAAVELATAYISLNVNAGNVKEQIRTAFNDAAKAGKDAGARMGSEMASGIRGKLAEKSWVKTALQDATTGAGQHSAKKFFDEFRTTSERAGAIAGLVIGKSLSAGIRGGIAARNIASGIFDKVKTTGVAMAKNVGSMIGNTFAVTIRAAIGGLGLGGAGLIAGVLFKGFDRLKLMDSARAKLIALNDANKRFGKTGVDVAKTIKDVQDVVVGTPFDLADSFDVAVSAIGGNVKDIKKYMTAVADAAAFANKPIGEMGYVFQDVVNKGYLAGEELSQLDTRFPATSWVRESVEKTGQDFDKLLEDGKLTLDMLIQAVEEHAPEMAMKLGDTLEGSITRVQSSMARLGADFLSAIFGGDGGDPAEGLKNSLNRVTEQFDRLDTWVNNHKEDIRNFFNDAKEAATGVVNAIRDISSFLNNIPGGVSTAVLAFAAFETIKGIAAVATALTGINTALGLMPGAAATATSSLGPLSAILTTILGAYLLLKDTPQLGNKGTVGNGGGIVPPLIGNGPGGIFGPKTAENGVLPTAPGMINGSTPTIGGIPIPGLQMPNQPSVKGSPGKGFPLQWPMPSNGGLNWATIDSLAAGRGLTMTSGYRDPNGPTLGGVPAWRSYHGSGRAHDYAGTPAQNAAFYSFMKATFGSQLKELIHEDVGTANEHVHVAFSTGGGVSGAGGPKSDVIPAMLSNGEHVLTAADVQQMGGQGAVYAFRNALHRAGGGQITQQDTSEWIDPPTNELPTQANRIKAQKETATGRYRDSMQKWLWYNPQGDPGNFNPNMRIDLSHVAVQDKNAAWNQMLLELAFKSPNGFAQGGAALIQGQVPWKPGEVTKTGPDQGNHPDLNTSINGSQWVGLPDWAPGTKFGPPPPGWWDKPLNPDDVLFPEWMPPGLKDWWLEQWGKRRQKWKTYGDGGAVDPKPLEDAAANGVDPNTTVHGTGQGAAPGPDAPPDVVAQQEPNYGNDFVRSLGFVPASAGNTSVAGTSSLAKFIGMGNDVVGGLIDTGTNLAQTAATAAIAAGSMGSSAAAGPAASAAASYGIQLAGQTAKRLSSYGFQMLGIGADALVEQLFPFGAPRWLGYDYAQFAPQLGIQEAFTSTIEKMGTDAIKKKFPKPGEQADPGGNPAPAGPVNPATMPGAPPPPAPNPNDGPDLTASGPSQAAPLTNPVANIPPDPMAGLFGYDQGGMLPPGGLGINMTSRPEPVLTPQQWDAIAASSSSPMKGSPLVENLYAQDMQDAIRQLEKVKRRDMMQYAGRP